MRFKDEADAVLGFGGHLVKIVRPGFGGTDGHSSETSINNFASEMLTCEVENTGDLEFYDATIKHIMKKHFSNVLPRIEPPPEVPNVNHRRHPRFPPGMK